MVALVTLNLLHCTVQALGSGNEGEPCECSCLLHASGQGSAADTPSLVEGCAASHGWELKPEGQLGSAEAGSKKGPKVGCKALSFLLIQCTQRPSLDLRKPFPV